MTVTKNLIPNAEQQFFDDNGNPLSLGTVEMYIPLSTTPKNTWTDPEGSTLNTFPIQLDIGGRAIIYGLGDYRQVVKDVDGNVIWDLDTAVPSAKLTPGTTFLRADIPTTTITVDTFIASGYYVAGDLGAGAIYTSVGAGSGSPGAIQDFVGTWFGIVIGNEFNAGWFGLKGDGTTETATITAICAAIPSIGAKVNWPPGLFKTAGGHTIANPCIMQGAGQTSLKIFQSGTDTGGTIIQCTSATSVCFTVTANWATFRDLTGFNAVNPVTAGSFIKANSAYVGAQVNYESITVMGFYDNIDVAVGSSWHHDKCNNFGAARYNLRIRNTVNPDYGDWFVTDSSFAPSANYNATCAIRVESSGGGKIVNNKVNIGWGGSVYDDCIQVEISASTGQMWILDNSMDAAASNAAINVIDSIPYINISNNFIQAQANTPGMILNDFQGGLIGPNIIVGNSAGSAIEFTGNSLLITILAQKVTGYTGPWVTGVTVPGADDVYVLDQSQYFPPSSAIIGPIDPRLPGFTSVASLSNNDSYVTFFQVPYDVTVSTVRFKVGVQSGNIDVGVYKFNSNTANYLKVATTGSIPCPATGLANPSLSAPATLTMGNLYMAIIAFDNATVEVYCSVGNIGNNASPVLSTLHITGVFPLPASIAIGGTAFASLATPVLVYF